MSLLSCFIGFLSGLMVSFILFVIYIDRQQHKVIVDTKQLIERNNELIAQVSRIISFNNQLAERNVKQEELINAALEEMRYHEYI